MKNSKEGTMKALNLTPLNVTKVKRWAARNVGYEASHYLCLIDRREHGFPEGFIAEDFQWFVYEPKQKGYGWATEKYPIKNTDDANYPSNLLLSNVKA